MQHRNAVTSQFLCSRVQCSNATQLHCSMNRRTFTQPTAQLFWFLTQLPLRTSLSSHFSIEITCSQSSRFILWHQLEVFWIGQLYCVSQKDVIKISTPCSSETKSNLTMLVSHIKPYCLYLLCCKYKQNPYIISFNIGYWSFEGVEPLYPIRENLEWLMVICYTRQAIKDDIFRNIIFRDVDAG